MKMPEKHDLLAAILAGKGTRHRGNPCVCNGAYLRGRYNGGAFTKTVIDANEPRHYRLVHALRDLLTLPD